MQKPIVRALFMSLIGIALIIPIALYAKNGVVTVSADEKVEGDLIRAGQVVRILAPVDGDVIVAGGTVEVAGPVTGDVIAAGGEVRITADVGGSVRAAGGLVEITGTVGRSVLAVGKRVVIGETAEIGWSASVATSDFVFSGRAGRDVRAWADQALIAGEVERNLTLFASAKDGVTLERTAIVQGDFEYTTDGLAALREGAVVKGKTTHYTLLNQDRREVAVGIILARLIRLFGLIIVGLILLSLVPKAIDQVTREEHFLKWWNLWEGFLWAISIPIVVFVYIMTYKFLPLALVLTPLSLILVVSWVVFVYLSQVVVSVFLGRLLFRHVFKSEERAPKFMDLVFGALVWVILTSIPWLGWMLCLVGALLGMGSLVAFKRQELARYR